MLVMIIWYMDIKDKRRRQTVQNWRCYNGFTLTETDKRNIMKYFVSCDNTVKKEHEVYDCGSTAKLAKRVLSRLLSRKETTNLSVNKTSDDQIGKLKVLRTIRGETYGQTVMEVYNIENGTCTFI